MEEYVFYEITNSYWISNLGRIYSLKSNKFLKSYLRSGYPTVSFQEKNFRIHRLLGQFFIPNPENLPIINHKDGNKTNNLNNLEWSTYEENTRHAWRLNLCKVNKVFGKHNGASRGITQLDLHGRELMKFDCIVEAKNWVEENELGTGRGITKCLSGSRKKAYGFKWVYTPPK